MTATGPAQKACNAIMELALTAACVAQASSTKCNLSEPADDRSPAAVTIDYTEGFHHQG